MTSFTHGAYSTRHPAVLQAERVAQGVRAAARRVSAGLQLWLKRQSLKRRQAAEDAKLWQMAQQDSRMMADLSRAMSAAGVVRNLKTYY